MPTVATIPAYVKQQERKSDDAQTGSKRREDEGKWWWFNDDKVTEVEAEKIETLSGGGKYISDDLWRESC